MKQAYGFIEFENIYEFAIWLSKQRVSRKIDGLQVHHMWEPDYSCWKTDIALRRQKNTRDFHINERGWGDIAQHFSIFPNGHIVTGRSLEKTPIGIKGWNTGKVCTEIYGNFDKGHDKMTKEQKESVIAFYALMSWKFNISINSTHIRPHCWFDANGNYLGNYSVSRSAKSCPGTGFFGGNTKASFNANFYPLIQKFDVKSILKGYSTSDTNKNIDVEDYRIKVITETLNVRKGPGTSYKKVNALHKGDVYTIIETNEAKTWGKLKSGEGWINIGKSYVENCPIVKKDTIDQSFLVKVITETLNVRKGPGVDYDITGELHKGDVYTIIETNEAKTWGKLKSGEGWINIGKSYVENYPSK